MSIYRMNGPPTYVIHIHNYNHNSNKTGSDNHDDISQKTLTIQRLTLYRHIIDNLTAIWNSRYPEVKVDNP